jgi:DNA polymerase III epsilon subunit-like protein
MKFIFYDTETTGLIPKKTGVHPYIVQFSYIVYETDSETIEKIYDEIISLPDGVDIPKEASDIHNITTEMTKNSIVKIEDCLLEFVGECLSADLIVGHNLNFDNAMVVSELGRYKESLDQDSEERENIGRIIQRFLQTRFYCTMQETIDFCNIIATYKKSTKQYVKFPKLIELHDKLFGKDTLAIQLHNSLNDVLVCFRCFYKYKFDVDVLSKIAHLI